MQVVPSGDEDEESGRESEDEQEVQSGREGEQEVAGGGRETAVTEESEGSGKKVTMQILTQWVEKVEKVSWKLVYGQHKGHY